MSATLYEFYKSQGKNLPSVAERKTIYQQMGLGSASEFVGTADQNNRLLAALQGGAVQATVQQPANPTAQVTQAVTQPQTSGGQAGEAELIQAMMAKGHTEETARAAISGRGLTDLAREYGVNLGSTTGIPGLSTQPSIDLSGIYKNLYDSSGISALEKDLSDKEKEYTEAKGKINENPFLSEATRVGRVAKLEQLFNERTANLRSDIEKKKADIETQLNLQMKQFDINSQQTQQALSQFNSLLSMGALTNASGADIANIARSTGLTSSMIEGAIAKSQEKEPQIISYDDGTNQGFVTVDKNTGEIINKQVIGASSGGAGGTATERELTKVQNALIQDVKSGMTLRDAISLYGDSLGLSDITRLYNQYSIYGAAKESGQEIQQIYLTSKKTPSQPNEGDMSSDGTQIFLNGRWQPL